MKNINLDNKLVLMGMSCVGKSDLASQLTDQGYTHYSFDAQYKYHFNGLGGVSKKRQWETIARKCQEPKFVLDNWSTEDHLGKTLYSVHPDAVIVVLFDTYENILRRYRIPVRGQDAHLSMFLRMYQDVPFDAYKNVRYLRVNPDHTYEEYSFEDFRFWLTVNPPEHNLTFNEETWTWE